MANAASATHIENIVCGGEGWNWRGAELFAPTVSTYTRPRPSRVPDRPIGREFLVKIINKASAQRTDTGVGWGGLRGQNTGDGGGGAQLEHTLNAPPVRAP